MKSVPARPKHHDGFANAFLRGLAILCVLILHVLSNIHGGFYTDSPTWRYAVGIDQFARFCVPLFVALSGFGFWQKYQKTELHAFRFIWSQAKKLLPLYILASVIFYILFLVVPQWQLYGVTHSLPQQILTGKADYHLYFVPMIFQLYILFPFLRRVVLKLPWVSLLLAAIFQVWFYSVVSAQNPSAFVVKYLLTDQQQYVWSFTWIFYFILGMHIPRMLQFLELRKWSVALLGAGAFFTWVWTATLSIVRMTNGQDPIIALRSTHGSVMLYSTIMILFLILFAQTAQKKVRKLLSPFVQLGNWSYPIYLFHTIVLRVIFSL